MTNSVRPHRRQPTRFPHPWDSPGKNTGVGCHFLLQCMKVKNESEVAQLCPTLVTLWAAAYQAPPSMGFSRQEYWSGVPLPSLNWGLFQGLSGKESTCQCRRHTRCRFHPWVGKIPWRKKWQPIPVFLPGISHGQKSLMGYRLWSLKELDMTKQLSTHTHICPINLNADIHTHTHKSAQNYLFQLYWQRPQSWKQPASV